MPCRDYYDDHPEQYFRDVTEPALKKQISFAESALCATLAALRTYTDDKQDMFSLINYEEAGITKAELKAWYKTHSELDVKHRAMEAEKKRKAALAKLTPEERKLLGVK